MNAPSLTFPYYSPTRSERSVSSISSLGSSVEWPASPRQSADFFFKDGNLTLQAEDVLYQVHTYLFERYSKSFVSKYLNKAPMTQTVVLEVSAHDLEQLLSVLYPIDFQSYTPRTVKQWSAVLALSTNWQFTSVRQLAIDKLTTLAGSAEMVALGRAHAVDEWLAPAYTRLCTRFKPIGMIEGEKLDKADIIRIMAVRHQIGIGRDINVRQLIEQTFNLSRHDGTSDPKESSPSGGYTRSVASYEASPRPSPVAQTLNSSVSDRLPVSRARSISPPLIGKPPEGGTRLFIEPSIPASRGFGFLDGYPTRPPSVISCPSTPIPQPSPPLPITSQLVSWPPPTFGAPKSAYDGDCWGVKEIQEPVSEVTTSGPKKKNKGKK